MVPKWRCRSGCKKYGLVGRHEKQSLAFSTRYQKRRFSRKELIDMNIYRGRTVPSQTISGNQTNKMKTNHIWIDGQKDIWWNLQLFQITQCRLHQCYMTSRDSFSLNTDYLWTAQAARRCVSCSDLPTKIDSCYDGGQVVQSHCDGCISTENISNSQIEISHFAE